MTWHTDRSARTEQLENKASEEKELGCQARNQGLRMRGHSCSFEHLTTIKEDSVHNGAEDTILAGNEKGFSTISHELRQTTQGALGVSKHKLEDHFYETCDFGPKGVRLHDN